MMPLLGADMKSTLVSAFCLLLHPLNTPNMDITQTTATAIHEVYAITCFIRETIKTAKNYSELKSDLQEQLDHEFAFVEAFKEIWLDGDNPLVDHPGVRDGFKSDVENVMKALKRNIAEYETEALRHNVNLRDDILDACKPQPKRPKRFLTEKMRARLEAMRLKASSLDWALFTQDKLQGLCEEYRKRTTHLREDLAFLTSIGVRPIDFQSNGLVDDKGLQRILQRQKRVKERPQEDYEPLQGDLTVSAPLSASGKIFSGIYSEITEDVVMVEARPYPRQLSDAVADNDADNVKRLKQPIVNLAWLLNQPKTLEGKHDSIHELSCTGYIDQPDEERILLVYSPPPSIGPKDCHTLYDWMSVSSIEKPTLGTRFNIAYTLAANLLTTFTSGWVHKEVCSQNVLMLGTNPALVGWGVARQANDETSLQEDLSLEPNLYRHEARYRKPTAKFTPEHDIYSLGVVLLEIGFWKPVLTLFGPRIQRYDREGYFPKHGVLTKGLRSLVGTQELKFQMGSMYTGVVEHCLTGVFDSLDTPGGSTSLLLDFRATVVEKLRYGVTL